MTIITDTLGDWEQLGTVSPSDQWQLFPVDVFNCETFRVTTTIINQQDWDTLKIRSGAYIRFYYPDGSRSDRIYIPVTDSPTIKQIHMPDALQNNGAITRSIGCILSNRYIGKYSINSYARWNLQLEALQ
ncbi:MAG: hypothetical protein RMX97_02670 [Nostoc sp. DedQUE11]|nr:hypothetical protein [Nostoc sp. DedQUE11]